MSRERSDISTHPVERLIATGPMPLAQLARRARNAKTGAAILQNSAHYLGEAGAALAACYWLARALAGDSGRPGDACRRQLSGILGRGAGFGHWVGLWREAAAQIGGEEQAALSRALAEQGPIESLISALSAEASALGDDGAALLKALKQARKRGVLGFFEFLTMFRNKVYGHGTMLAESSCQRLAAPFLAAVVHVLAQECVFQGAWLGRTAIDLLSEHQNRYWLRLSGVAESALGTNGVGGRDVPSADDYPPGTLYFVTERGPLALDFWVVQDEDATGLSRFGFFQRAVARRKATRSGSGSGSNGGSSYRGVEYLDYLGGRFRHDTQLDTLKERADSWFLAGDEQLDRAAKTAESVKEGDRPDERRFGDFVIEGELGRGAMGIVYRATQVSLGRSVALKVLPPALLGDPIALGRFHREVQALGRCDHPNVVRVLAYGVEEGRPWFAMELVEGADLSEVFKTLADWKGKADRLTAGHLSAASSSVADRQSTERDAAERDASERDATARASAEPASRLPVPLEPAKLPDPGQLEGLNDDLGLYRRLASLFAEAAAGVEEIHRRGVVHRDLKPANLMLSRTGDRLVVMDLGLAKMADMSMSYTREAGSDFVGSARYAAPEQLQAKLLAVDHRADVYSLGATLYELVTLHALYPAHEIAELLQHKLNHDPVPARERERAIPRDLETILQKSLARRPEDRYASATELADDLRAFAAHQPIQARPPSAFEYLRLFYHRQRRLVHLGATALTALFAVIAVSFILVAGERSRALSERDNAQRERDNAKSERDRAESLATFIFDDLYDRLEPIGKLEFLRDVTARMSEHYQSRDLNDPAVAVRYAQAIVRTGEVEHQGGRAEIAAQHYRQARDLLIGLSAQITRPDHPQYDAVMATLAQTHYDLAGVDFNQNRLDEALKGARRALEIREVLHAKNPYRREFVHARAESYRQIGVAMERKGERREALAAYYEAVSIAESAVRADPDDAIAREELATNRINMAESLYQLGDFTDALKQLNMALTGLEELSQAAPLNMRVRRQTATCHDAIARLRVRANDAHGALHSYEQARDLRLRLVELEPGRSGWQRDLATSHGNSADILLRQGDLDGALERYRAGLAIFSDLIEHDPSNVRWQMDVAVTQAQIGKVWEKRGQLDRALAKYREALSLSERVVGKDSENSVYKQRVGDYHGMIAAVLDRQGQVEQALASLVEKRSIIDALAERDPDNASLRADLVDVWHLTGALFARQNRVEAALSAWQKARQINVELAESVRDRPDSPSARSRTRTTAELHRLIARSQHRLGRKVDARASYQQALTLYGELDEPDVDRQVVRGLTTGLASLDRKSSPGPDVLNATTDAPDMTTQPLQSRSRKNDVYE